MRKSRVARSTRKKLTALPSLETGNDAYIEQQNSMRVYVASLF